MSHTQPLSSRNSTHTGEKRRVVIVGGGISGLSAAWYLQRQAAERNERVEYTLLEAGPRWGGKVLTERVVAGGSEFVVEAGPDAFITQKRWALELAYELGIGDRLIGINDRISSIFVLDRGRPVRMPDGVLLVVPTRFWPFVSSRLFSLRGKLRMGLDLLIPARRDDGDETLAQFIRRRLGNEALEKIAEPLMSGIYNADAEAMSIMATFPRFREIEQNYGSLIRGMVRSRVASARPDASKPAPAFMSLQGGTQELIDALVPRLWGDLRLDTRVLDLHALPGGGYRLITNQEDVLHADAVILTTPAYTTADLLAPIARDAAGLLREIRYVGTGTVSFAFRTKDITKPMNGLGIVVPKGANRPINAITISSTKFSHRAPKDMVLLRAFFGGSRSPASMEYDDEKLLGIVKNELRDILGIEAAPLFHRTYRWPNANPQYDVGHLERVTQMEACLPRNVYLTGAAYRGVGMPDCVHQACCTVELMMSELAAASSQKAEA